MSNLTRAQTATILRALGWRVDTTAHLKQAVENFQEAFNLGARLEVDGQVGPATTAGLLLSEKRRRAGRTTISAHFDAREFACKCGGRYASCERIKVVHEQLQSLEKLRATGYGSITVVSGYRCPGHNRAVGGASDSQHLYGGATDIQMKRGWTDAEVAKLHAFSGIGFQHGNHLVRHVDRRDKVDGHHNGGTLAKPMRWQYS